MQSKASAKYATRQGRTGLVGLLSLCAMFSACRHHDSNAAKQYLGKERQAEYIDQATRISYTDVEQIGNPNVNFAIAPRTIRQTEKEELWDLTLAEVVQITLANSKVIRSQAQFMNPGNPILSNPDFAQSVYDPAIQESGVLFGQRGVEAALSDFDTQFTTQMLWGRNETVQNNTFSAGFPAGNTLVDETAAFNASLQKRLATGGQVGVFHTWNYTGRNVGTPPQLFPSVYEGNVSLQFRQPLLAGGGVEYTRIAGPVSTNIQGVTGVQQGVIIARINNDIELAEFERAVHQMIHDVESLYWQLHLAYHTYDIFVKARNAVVEDWRKVEAQRRASTGNGSQEADFRDSYLDLKNRADLARDQIYSLEAQLRLLMCLPVNDGRVIRPIDDPITAEFIPNWQVSLADALMARPELRRAKWGIRSLELQLIAAKNLTNPRLDFVSAYQVNGFGDDLFDQGGGDDSNPANPDRFASAYERMLSGNETGWNLGFEFSIPLGRRFALAQVRSLELRLAKSQAILAEAEVEISHEIASVLRDVDRNYLSMENAYNRLATAQDRLVFARSQYESNPERYNIESVLRAHSALAQAELQFISAMVQYNSSITDLNFRTGRILHTNNIHLIEGPWVKAAYDDARQQYDARKHGIPNPLLHTEP